MKPTQPRGWQEGQEKKVIRGRKWVSLVGLGAHLVKLPPVTQGGSLPPKDTIALGDAAGNCILVCGDWSLLDSLLRRYTERQAQKIILWFVSRDERDRDSNSGAHRIRKKLLASQVALW